MLVGDVAPHHHALTIRSQHTIDAIDMLVINLFCSNGIDVCLGVALSKALGFVAVDVEVGRLISSCHFTEMVFKELVGLFLSRVEVPFRVGQMAVKRIAQNLLKMPETLLVSNDLDVIRFAEIF